MIHVQLPRWLRKEQQAEVLFTEEASSADALTEEQACHLISSCGYKPIVSCVHHVHAVQVHKASTGSLYEDERHICLLTDLASFNKQAFLALVETTFVTKGYTHAFVLAQ